MVLPESKTLVCNFDLSSSRYYILKAHWLNFFLENDCCCFVITSHLGHHWLWRKKVTGSDAKGPPRRCWSWSSWRVLRWCVDLWRSHLQPNIAAEVWDHVHQRVQRRQRWGETISSMLYVAFHHIIGVSGRGLTEDPKVFRTLCLLMCLA